LTDEGWRKLTIRWTLFFVAMAVLNEIVWRTQSTDTWVSFKLFGVLPLTFVFGALQVPLLTKYAPPEPAKGPSAELQSENRRAPARRFVSTASIAIRTFSSCRTRTGAR